MNGNIFFLFLKMPISVEHLIALMTFQCVQTLIAPRMFSVWAFIVKIFARKTMVNVGWVLSIPFETPSSSFSK